MTATDDTPPTTYPHPTASRYTVACLSGSGAGPEVMAEASRTLAELSTLHGFRIDEIHPPFGHEAIARSGQPLPASTLAATRSADAVLVAGSSRTAVAGIESELEPSAFLLQALLANGSELVLLAPLRSGTEDWTIERAFRSAEHRAGRIAAVGVGTGWQGRVDRHAERGSGVAVEQLPLAAALHRLAPTSAVSSEAEPQLLVVEARLVDALLEVAQVDTSGLPAATGLLGDGPGIFSPYSGPVERASHKDAGQGVANPSSMLIAAALLLREGLGRHAAAETLEAGVAAAMLQPIATLDRAPSGSLASSTREFVDVVLGLLPRTRRDLEFAIGGSA